jgi:type I restriction enzyme M protein
VSALAPITALIVPYGKVIDFIDGTIRNETPEEYVRQEIEKSLVREYEYPREEIRVEFRVKMGSSSKRCDLAIFPEGAPASQEHVWAICECKAASVPPDSRTDGVEQLQSYMAACPNAEFGMWTNGQERFCYRKVSETGKWKFMDIADLPVKGRPLEEAERPTRDSLKAAESDALLFTFRRCHNYIAANQGLQKSEAFWELLKLIFCKIEDERSDLLHFYATTQEWQTLNGQMKVGERIGRLFREVRDTYPAIFEPNEEINLEPRVLAYIVAQLQVYSLLESEVDVKGKAYEEIVGSNLRGDRGEFFTPRNVCRMAIEMLDPGPKDIVLDPACGTGGFLIVAMNHVREKIRAAEQAKWSRPDNPTANQLTELVRKENVYLRTRIVGIDFNPHLVKAAKMNMVMNNDGSGGLFQGNSLERPAVWSDELRKRDLIANVDLLFTNPPFGMKLPIMEPSILEQYDLAHAWDYDADTDSYTIREPRVLTKAQPPEVLFVERCVRFLKPGGRLAIVLPDAILGAPGLGHVREWIFQQTRVLASIDMHPDTFQPHNSTQTSLLVLQRKGLAEIELEKAAGHKTDYKVFLALANHVGHDKRGNRVYVRDGEGNELLIPRTEHRREVRDGVSILHDLQTHDKLPDDTTLQIAQRFRTWASANL